MKSRQQVSPIGMEIKIALIRKNMEAKELAHRIGKAKSTVSDVISGRNQCTETIELIRKELEI